MNTSDKKYLQIKDISDDFLIITHRLSNFIVETISFELKISLERYFYLMDNKAFGKKDSD